MISLMCRVSSLRYATWCAESRKGAVHRFQTLRRLGVDLWIVTLSTLKCSRAYLKTRRRPLVCHSFNLIMFQGICSKCQPSAVTLNRQPWRHTDSVMFENSQLVDRFVCLAGVQNLYLPAILRLSLPIPSQPAEIRLSLPGSFSFGEKVVHSALAGSMAGARNPLAFKLSWISKNLDKIPII